MIHSSYSFQFKGVSDNGIKISASGTVEGPVECVGEVFEAAKQAVRDQLPGVQPKDGEITVRKLKRKPR